ncbi:biopolymer transporter ExbD [Flavobacteriaceae bacterium]|jgi:biopolymer transport protein ExbD|nr:biopolymer transporter ExbD [Flavobacteriaceae bacterium]MBT4313106.1 biopolymer transporter ExbD [Flavobacteriaceae bacterium]MBT5090987.1 biopolymer transporter ExbD [Flavobacteriaceae bacterium]MBT5284213.1 biopolymer transporter ExbD [Flavobacteriaceae bacterium]MBT5447194.1 biopolymer transporter ExbD [Flavobacteriaceae bacterium]|tara:strand:+ start:4227 stop:4625 length:399 start_codon:yes stop_codon:yes gene_type:complete
MKLRGRNQIRPEFNMSSMTDVVFLLLIFFMIASTLSKQLNTIEVKLPQADGKTENRSTVAVTITNANQYYIDSDRVSKRRLENKLISVLSSLNTPSIVLRTEKKVAIDEVVYVMNIANKNGIKVVLAVETPQ